MKSVNCVNGSGKSFRLSTGAFVFVFMAAILTILIATEGAAQAHDVDEQSTIAATQQKCEVRAKGLTTLESDFDVVETVARLQEEILDRGLGIFAIIDHAANAEGVGMELRPTTLILFGSPAVGTVLMQSQQTIGIDLPLKYLVWEDACGKVRVGYNSTKFLKKRHKIKDRDQVFENIANALNAIAQAAAED
jgi:uncharacterized protein (DUF302 family)